jgi:hypothetical protein
LSACTVSGDGDREELNASEGLPPSDIGIPIDGMSETSRGSPRAPIDGPSLRGVSSCADGPERGDTGMPSPWNILISTLVYVCEATHQHSVTGARVPLEDPPWSHSHAYESTACPCVPMRERLVDENRDTLGTGVRTASVCHDILHG